MSRTAYPGGTPRVEYALTETGRGVLGLFDMVGAWTAQHWNELLDAREAYDDAAKTIRGA
ncbi:winged helix-turn-helix transcriptional regulator [Streptomyces shenzhenensis]|uniref:winged helix-turn-helix transcriptional regulator n=1 Tax=Streptomyces shenzhenensis TaxID=943815 RepID=UPI00380DDF3C